MTPFSLKSRSHSQVFTHENTPVLTVTTHLPHSDHPHPMARRFDRYYQAQQKAYIHYAQHYLLPQAIKLWQESQAQSLPFTPKTATLTHHITYQDSTHLSLYTQAVDTVEGGRYRRGDTWALDSGFLVPIRAFFPDNRQYKKLLTQEAMAQIETLQSQGLADFYPQVGPSLLKRRFNPHHYYLTPQGLCFFYPMYAIAPAVEQIPVFFHRLS